MTQKTKDILKKVNELLMIGLMTFAWLMACVGITAYSVYWLRQNANYQQETSKREVKQKRLIANNNYRVGFSVYDDLTYYSRGRDINSVADFLEFSSSDVTDQSLSLQLSVVDNTSFDNFACDVLFYRFQEGFNQYFSVDVIYFATRLDNSVTSSGDLVNVSTSTLNTRLFDFSFDSYNIRYYTTGFSVLDFDSFFSFLFDVHYDSRYTTLFDLDFTNPYLNFEQLLSYSRVGVYDFIKVGSPFGSYYEIPIYFEYNNTLYESIIIQDIYVVQYINDDGQKVYYQDISGDVTNYLMTCWAVYFLEFGGSYVQDPSVTTGFAPVPLVGDLLQVAYREVAYYEPSILGSGTTYNNYPVWNMTKGYNTYGRINYDLYVSNESLDDIPFPNNDVSSAHYPLQNITTRDILNYITTYNTDGFTNYGVSSDIGLGGTFTLLRCAFVGLIDLFSISIIPGITFGLLVFLPIIVGVIIVILRLVKK